jgi:metal-responsive CopG/Arc/MetJ family transcriptional regulator
MCSDVRILTEHDKRAMIPLMAVRTNLLLPRDLVDEVDHFAGPRGRSRYVAEALRARIKRDRLREVVERTAGALRAEEYPHWSTPEKVVEWVRELRAEETDSGPRAS